MKKNIVIVYSKPLRLGAQEKDTLSGIELCKNFDTNIIQVEIDFGIKSINSDRLLHVPISHFEFLKNLFSTYIKFFLCKLFVWDPALRESIKIDYFKFMSKLSLSFPNSIIITEGSNLLPLTIFFRFRVSRSHNFEPLHAYREQKVRLLGYLYFIIKLQSVIYERVFSDIACISQRDASLYKFVPSTRQVIIIPLRDLVIHFRSKFNIEFKNQLIDSVAYLGSSYNVFHNKVGLDFFIREVFSSPELDHIKLNIYGSKSGVFNSRKNIVIKDWVEDLEEIYYQNDVFLCYKGGTGQQSKVFEPLSRGKILICNPDLLYGHDLFDETHFLAAKTSVEFKKQILRVFENPQYFDYMRKNAFEYCLSHFSYEKNLLKLKNILQF
jgi:hypothetical protein